MFDSPLDFEIQATRLQEVVEIPFRTHSSPHSEDVRRQDLRVQFDVIRGAVPKVPRIGQQVVYLVGLIRSKLEICQRNLDPARLLVTRIQIYDDENNIGQIVGGLAVGNELVIVKPVESQAPIALQGTIFPPNLVHARDQSF